MESDYKIGNMTNRSIEIGIYRYYCMISNIKKVDAVPILSLYIAFL